MLPINRTVLVPALVLFPLPPAIWSTHLPQLWARISYLINQVNTSNHTSCWFLDLVLAPIPVHCVDSGAARYRTNPLFLIPRPNEQTSGIRTRSTRKQHHYFAHTRRFPTDNKSISRTTSHASKPSPPSPDRRSTRWWFIISQDPAVCVSKSWHGTKTHISIILAWRHSIYGNKDLHAASWW